MCVDLTYTIRILKTGQSRYRRILDHRRILDQPENVPPKPTQRSRKSSNKKTLSSCLAAGECRKFSNLNFISLKTMFPLSFWLFSPPSYRDSPLFCCMSRFDESPCLDSSVWFLMAIKKVHEMASVSELLRYRMQLTKITPFGIYVHCITTDFVKENPGENFKEYNIREIEKM